MTAHSKLFEGIWSPPQATNPAAQLLQNVCETRREKFLERWRDDPAIPIFTPESELDKIYFGPDHSPCHFGKKSELANVKTSDAVIITVPGNCAFYTSLWVRNDFKGYVSAFRKFLEIVHQIPSEEPTLGSLGYDIDHLRNKASTPPGTFIRIEAIPSAPQRAWGRNYERALSSPEFDKKAKGITNWMTVAKIAGFHPPADWDDTKWVQKLEEFSTNNSIDYKTDLMKELVGRELERTYMHRKKGSAELAAARKLRNQTQTFGL